MTQSVIKHVHQAYDTIMLPHSEMASVHKPTYPCSGTDESARFATICMRKRDSGALIQPTPADELFCNGELRVKCNY